MKSTSHTYHHLCTCLTVAAAAASMLCCRDLTRCRDGKETAVAVTITEISRDDLGRIIVFALDADMKTIVFVKDFYSARPLSREIKAKMNDYAGSIKKYRGSSVLIRYYVNNIGDNVIISFTGPLRQR